MNKVQLIFVEDFATKLSNKLNNNLFVSFTAHGVDISHNLHLLSTLQYTTLC